MERCYIWVSEDYDVLAKVLNEAELCLNMHSFSFPNSPQDTPFEDGEFTQLVSSLLIAVLCTLYKNPCVFICLLFRFVVIIKTVSILNKYISVFRNRDV